MLQCGNTAADFARRNGHVVLANELRRIAERAKVIVKHHFLIDISVNLYFVILLSLQGSRVDAAVAQSPEVRNLKQY